MRPVEVRPGPRFVLTGASELFRPDPGGTSGARRAAGEVVYVDKGRIVFVGPEERLPSEATSAPRHDVGGRAVLPGFVDAHTHIVFGGDRIEDFDRRARGLSYAEIAAAGGGIVTTVRATRAEPTERLLARGRAALLRRREQGVFTTEVKSGYGLDTPTELRMLEVVASLRAEGFDVEPTLLAAHALPPDRPRAEWVDEIVTELIPEVQRRGLATSVDAFVERSAYTPAEARTVFSAAAAAGLGVRLHADQLSSTGGAELAAEAGALSADHLEHISPAGIEALAAAGVVAGLLPGAMVHLGQRAPGLGRRLVEAGVEVMVATDANPGSSPTHNLGLAATLAVTQLGLTPEQATRAATLGAARALGRADVGHLERGARARFVVLDHPDSRAWVASFGEPVLAEIIDGEGVSPSRGSA